MTGTALIFFLLFALIIVGMYLGVRREWARPGGIALVGGIASMITMALFSLAQGNPGLQAVVVGVLVGGVFTALTVSIANFFRGDEARAGEVSSDEPE